MGLAKCYFIKTLKYLIQFTFIYFCAKCQLYIFMNLYILVSKNMGIYFIFDLFTVYIFMHTFEKSNVFLFTIYIYITYLTTLRFVNNHGTYLHIYAYLYISFNILTDMDILRHLCK